MPLPLDVTKSDVQWRTLRRDEITYILFRFLLRPFLQCVCAAEEGREGHRLRGVASGTAPTHNGTQHFAPLRPSNRHFPALFPLSFLLVMQRWWSSALICVRRSPSFLRSPLLPLPYHRNPLQHFASRANMPETTATRRNMAK